MVHERYGHVKNKNTNMFGSKYFGAKEDNERSMIITVVYVKNKIIK